MYVQRGEQKDLQGSGPGSPASLVGGSSTTPGGTPVGTGEAGGAREGEASAARGATEVQEKERFSDAPLSTTRRVSRRSHGYILVRFPKLIAAMMAGRRFLALLLGIFTKAVCIKCSWACARRTL